MCSHYEGAAIFVVSPSDDVRQKIAEVASEFHDLQVITRTAGAPISQLFAVGTKVLKSPEMQGVVVGVAPDMYSGGLLVTVAQEKWPLSENDKRLIDDTVEAINGSPLPLNYEQGGQAELSTRAAKAEKGSKDTRRPSAVDMSSSTKAPTNSQTASLLTSPSL